MFALLLASLVHGADEPGLWFQSLTAGGVQPGALIESVTLEYRAPVLRYGGAAFNDTFVGAGGRASITPAFSEFAARASAQPIDVLPVTFEAVHTIYFDNAVGMVGMETLDNGTRFPERLSRIEDGFGFGSSSLTLSASPTLQLKAGPIVGFTNWTFASIRVRQPDGIDTAYVFDPFRGIVIAWNDWIIEHTSAILAEQTVGSNNGLLRVGPATRGRWSVNGPDRTLTLGGLVQYRPSDRRYTPSFLLLISRFLQDPDFLGPAPNVLFAVTIENQ